VGSQVLGYFLSLSALRNVWFARLRLARSEATRN